MVCGRAAVRHFRLAQAEFVQADVGAFLASESSKGASGELILANPPRGGLDRGVPQAIVARRPARVILVSCDPPTLGRDLKLLVEGGLRLRRVTPLDMFPQTSHIETMLLLENQDEA